MFCPFEHQLYLDYKVNAISTATAAATTTTIITSAKVMFLPQFVGWFCLSVSEITQQVIGEFS